MVLKKTKKRKTKTKPKKQIWEFWQFKKTKKRKSKKKYSWKLKLMIAFLWCFLVGLIIGGSFLAYCYYTLPDVSKAIYVERRNGIKILAEDGREVTSYGALFAEPVNVDELPSYVYQAVIDTEDRRFFEHHGFDYIGFIRAMAINVVKLRYAQGASTLTQQVAKNLFLTREKNIKRKVQEYLLASWLESHFSKKQILNIYLNRVFFGSGAYGLNVAAKRFFKKDAKKLNLREAAILAGALKAPSRYNYLRNKELAIQRADVVLSLMKRAGTITAEEMEKAKEMPIGESEELQVTEGRYFGDYVVENLNAYIGETDNDVYVKTTLDYDLQRKAERILKKHLEANKTRDVTQGAIVVLNNTGEIKAMVGGVDYDESQFNRAYQAMRQAGSSFKLFVYLAAFERDFEPSELLVDEPIKIGDWEPMNYDKKFHGAVSIKEAFAQSLNVATVDLATYLSLAEIRNLAEKLGVTTDVTDKPAIILGASEVKVLDMAAAYTVVANGGYRVIPYAITGVRTSDGEVLYEYESQETEQILKSEAVVKMKELLREVVLNGTGKRARWIKNAGGKTGTSQKYRDAWFIGSTDTYTAAVWVGNDDNSPMKGVGGGSVPTDIWADLMR